MTNSYSLLSGYQALLQNHINQFDSEIAALKQLVQVRMRELRTREQALFEAQAAELKRITDALAIDARCLLPTPELNAFVQEFKQMSHAWYSQKPKSLIADDPTTWVVATLEWTIGLSNYQILIDPNDYDDEHTHISYSYSLSLRLANTEDVFEIPYKRTYNLNEHRNFSLKEQIDNIAGNVEVLLKEINCPKNQRSQLEAEISVLVGYAIQVLTLKPRKAIFEYTSIGDIDD